MMTCVFKCHKSVNFHDLLIYIQNTFSQGRGYEIASVIAKFCEYVSCLLL